MSGVGTRGLGDSGATEDLSTAHYQNALGVPEFPSPLVPSYLNRSSKAFRALFVVDPPSPDDEVGLLVWRSIVVRGANIGQMFFSSFGAMRIGSFELCVHSHRALVSNDTQ